LPYHSTKVPILTEHHQRKVPRPGFVSQLSLQARTCFTGTNVPAYWYKRANTDTRRAALLDAPRPQPRQNASQITCITSTNTDAEGAALASLSALQRRLMLLKLLLNHNISLLALLVQKYKY